MTAAKTGRHAAAVLVLAAAVLVVAPGVRAQARASAFYPPPGSDVRLAARSVLAPETAAGRSGSDALFGRPAVVRERPAARSHATSSTPGGSNGSDAGGSWGPAIIGFSLLAVFAAASTWALIARRRLLRRH